MYKIFSILLSMINLTGRQKDITQANFNKRLFYLQFLHYSTTNWLQKKFPDGSSGTDTEKMIESFTYNGKHRFVFCKCAPQPSQPSAKLSEIL